MTTLSGTTLSGAETHIDSRAIDDLTQDLSRPPILPDSADYDEARRVFNKMIDKRPALIVRCGGVADVLRAVRFARDHDLIVAVRGGAHNAAGFATCDGGIVIDLSPMRAVRVDADNRLVRVEGGATWGDVDRETEPFGLVAVGGIVSTTGVAGLTLGGGQGWFRRTFGMTCDNLVSADVVTADGRLLSVSETAHPDLFWALKGGGGNFGIVTSFEFRLHSVGPMVAFAGPVYAMDKARTILRRFAEFASERARRGERRGRALEHSRRLRLSSAPSRPRSADHRRDVCRDARLRPRDLAAAPGVRRATPRYVGDHSLPRAPATLRSVLSQGRVPPLLEGDLPRSAHRRRDRGHCRRLRVEALSKVYAGHLGARRGDGPRRRG